MVDVYITICTSCWFQKSSQREINLLGTIQLTCKMNWWVFTNLTSAKCCSFPLQTLSLLCSSNLATSRRLITFSSIKQVIPLASFSSSGFCVPIAERAHLLFLRGKIVCGITTALPPDPMIMEHSGGGLLRFVLLCRSIVTRSSLEVLLEEASPAFVLGACSHGLSLMVTNLSLAFSETMSVGLVPLWVADLSHGVAFRRPLWLYKNRCRVSRAVMKCDDKAVWSEFHSW